MDNDKRFYVYFHRRKDTGEVFYIGKGTDQRYKRSREYKSWKTVVSAAGGFIPEIYKDCLSSREALDLERDLIKSKSEEWPLVNKRLPVFPNKIDQDELISIIGYDEQSPSSLVWKSWNRSHIHKTAKFAGDIAGYICKYKNGPSYYRLRVLGKNLLAHRVVWMLFNGEIPDGYVINHIDNNSLNNKIENLELISQKGNCQKTIKQKKEGVGVSLLVVGNHRYWVASWTNIEGIKQTALMSCLKLGEEAAYLAAKERRKAELIKLNEQGASYII